MSTLVIGFAWVTAAVLLSVFGAIRVRRTVPVNVLRSGEEEAIGVIGVLGTLYAVLLAFTVVIVWDHYTNATAAVEAETGELGDLSRLAKAFDPADEQRIRQHLVAYMSVVIEREWPAMAHGGDSERAWEVMGNLWTTYRSISPQTPARQAVFSESIAHLARLSDARRQRLHALHDDVPGIMWIVIVGGGVMVVMFTYLFAPERLALHMIMVGTVAAMIALNMFMIYALDNPYRGWPSVGTDIMRRELTRIQHATYE